MAGNPEQVLRKEFPQFLHELNSLLAHTITKVPLLRLPSADPLQSSFSFPGEGFAVLKSPEFGDIKLSLQQVCSVTERDGQLCLCTLNYSYGVGPADREDPTFRWDYERARNDPAKKYCRHHLQGDLTVQLGSADLPLDKHHMPTGYVPVEDIIRFCLDDLHVEALVDDWDARLDASYETFSRRFGRAPGWAV